MAFCEICNSEFTKKRVTQNICGEIDCKKKRQISYRQKSRKKNKAWLCPKQRARNALRDFLKKNSIKMVCYKCGASEKVEYHHRTYSRPFDVVPVCRKHHLEIHRKQKK